MVFSRRVRKYQIDSNSHRVHKRAKCCRMFTFVIQCNEIHTRVQILSGATVYGISDYLIINDVL